nr:PREDICTED: prostaglandin reductase 1-like isoform X3 [Bemisia tabaci]
MVFFALNLSQSFGRKCLWNHSKILTSSQQLLRRSLSSQTDNMVKNKKFILVKHFEGEIDKSCLKLEEENVPTLKANEVLTEALWMSVDPYMRPYSAHLPLNSVMIGSQVAKVVESKNERFKVGQLVLGYFGWQTHTVWNPSEMSSALGNPYVLPDFGDLPPSLGLGIVGMPGLTAYFGLLELCDPKPKEVVVVNSAAGAVGSCVGQIAKNKGCFVIGFAGSDKKVKWLKETLKFDAAFNYKTKDVSEALKEAAPGGVDVYFDNVGGEFSSSVLYQMKDFGRVAVCGSISSYNADHKHLPKATIIQPPLIFKQLKMEGFVVTRWKKRYEEGIGQLLKWVKEGKLVYEEHVTEGFEKLPDALLGLFQGENTGKAVVKV